MTQATCGALSAVFPLILVTLAIEHPRVLRHVQRNGPVLNNIIGYGMAASLAGLVASIIGVQIDGLPFFVSIFVWIFFGGSVLVIALVLMSIVQFEHEEHEEQLQREREALEHRRLAQLEAERRSRVWWRRLLQVSR